MNLTGVEGYRQKVVLGLAILSAVLASGEGGIRTLGDLATTPVFET
jgi:hypothetical protein